MATRVGRSAAGLAVALVGAGLAVATLVLALADTAGAPSDALGGLDIGWTIAIRTAVQTAGLLTLSTVAAILIWRQPRNPFSWILGSTLLVVASVAFASQYAIHGLVISPGSLPFADMAAWISDAAGLLVSLGAILALLFFPDGKLKSARWWMVAAGALVAAAIQIVAGFDNPYPLWVGLMGRAVVPATYPPVLWAVGASLAWASGAALPAVLSIGLVAGAGVILRMRASRGEARLQLKWFSYAAAIYVVAAVVGRSTDILGLDWMPESLRQLSQTDVAGGVAAWGGVAAAIAGMVLAPAAIAIAILRYRLYDIDIVINRTILYGGLAVFVTLTYGVFVAGLGSLLGQRVGSNPVLTVVAIAVVAALLLPVRTRLQSLANAAVYGTRARPYDVLSDFAGSIGRAESADVLLRRMARLLRDGTGASTSEVWVSVGGHLQLAASDPAVDLPRGIEPDVDAVAARFRPAPHVERVFHEGELLGVLVVAQSRGDELIEVERRLIGDLASQAGLVLVRFRLLQELRESRLRLVAAQDVERRRIERNLHDGAQQRFVNALLALGMADVATDGENRDLVHEATREVRAGLGELRQLARGLQPPLLAEAGLAAAVLALADRAPIATSVTASLEERYAEPVETTAYFVIAEALANAAKHSQATTVAVTIARSGNRLHVLVADDGIGGVDLTRGSGLLGLQDRVAALGGEITVSSGERGGTTISVNLPCG